MRTDRRRMCSMDRNRKEENERINMKKHFRIAVEQDGLG